MNARSQPSLIRAVRALRARASARAATRPRIPVPVLIAYADVPSARHALARMTALLQSSRRDAELHPMLWRFDQLDQQRWQEMALRDATRAEAVVFAMSHETAFDARTEAWLNALLGHLRGTRITVLAFVGSEAWTITLAQPQTATKPAAAPPPPAVAVLPPAPPKIVTACAA